MSQDFLSQVIRSYGGAMQGVVGSYLEQSLKLLAAQQRRCASTCAGTMGSEACDAISALTQKNYRTLALGAGRDLPQADDAARAKRRRRRTRASAERESGVELKPDRTVRT